MIAKRTIAVSTFVAASLTFSVGSARAGDDWAEYESKVKEAKACIRRQAHAYAASAQEAEKAARLAFGRCEHLFKEGNAAHAKAAGLSPKEADSVMAAGRRLATRELVEVISNIRQGRPAEPLEAPAAK